MSPEEFYNEFLPALTAWVETWSGVEVAHRANMYSVDAKLIDTNGYASVAVQWRATEDM